MSENAFSLYHITHPPTKKMAGKSPLLLLLHGYGSNEDDLMSLALQLDQRFFAVSARAPYPLNFGGSAWCLLSETAEGLNFDMDEAQSSLLLVEKLIDETVKAYDLDPSQVYVMGFSQGAALALTLALNKPEKIAGAVVMSGKYLEPLISLGDPKRLEGKPIFVAHGLSDDVLPIAEGRLIRDKLSETTVALSFHEYLMGHTVSVESFYDIALWLTEQLSDAEHEKLKS